MLVGLLYVILAVLLLLIALRRAHRSDEDFAGKPPSSRAIDGEPEFQLPQDAYRPTHLRPQDVDATIPRVWGRQFRTCGDAVLLVGVVGTVLYAGLFLLVMELY